LIPNITLDPQISVDDAPTWCCSQECVVCKVHNNPPIIFIHGHSMNFYNTPEASMLAFNKLQIALEEKGIINRGEWLWNDDINTSISWNMFNQSSSIRTSYYFIWNYQLGTYSVQAQKSERIE